MKTVEMYARVRRAVLVGGMSRRAVAREFGLARKTVGKMLEFSLPPGYRRQKPVRRPKLGPWQGAIDAILEDDKQRPRKQRHTAKRIFERLRAEHAYTGGYTIVKDYVRAAKLGGKEMFIPLTHAPGEAQADFGEAQVEIAGVEQKAHYMAFDLPHSDDCFVQAFPAETTEAFLEAHCLTSCNRVVPLQSSVAISLPCTCCDCHRSWPTDGPHESCGAAGAGKSRRATGRCAVGCSPERRSVSNPEDFQTRKF
jgi:transposase